MFPNKSNISRYFLFLTIGVIHPWVKVTPTIGLEESPLLNDHHSENEAREVSSSRITTVGILTPVCPVLQMHFQNRGVLQEKASFKLKVNFKKEKH